MTIDGNIEVAIVTPYYHLDVLSNDFVFFTSSNSQHIIFGTNSNNLSIMNMCTSNVKINNRLYIGCVDPYITQGAQFELSDAGSNNQFILYNNSNNRKGMYINTKYDVARLSAYNWTASNPLHMTLQDSGSNLGIGLGMSNPYALVHMRYNTNSNNILFEAGRTSDGNNEGLSTINFNGFYCNADRRITTNKNRWRMYVDQRNSSEYMCIDTYNGITNCNFITLSNNNVGINFMNPVAQFHILGNAVAAGTDSMQTSNHSLTLQDSGGIVRMLHKSSSPTDSTAYNYETNKNIYWGETPDLGMYRFRGRFVSIQSNLGIGTLTPSERLEVNGNILLTSTGYTGYIYSGDALTIQPRSGDLIFNPNILNGNVIYQINQVEKSRLTSTGSLCLGSNNAPSGTILYAYSNTSGPLITTLHNGNNGSNSYSKIGIINDTSNGCYLYLNSSSRSNDGLGNSATLRNDAGDLRIMGNNSNSYIFFQGSTGRIGINTISPDDTLNIVGDNSITGNNYTTGNTYTEGTLSCGQSLTVESEGASITGTVTIDGDINFVGPQQITNTIGNLTISSEFNMIYTADKYDEKNPVYHKWNSGPNQTMYLTNYGDLFIIGQYYAGVDTSSNPGYSWATNSNTGMYNIGANKIGFSTGGSNRVTIDSNGITSAKFYGDGSSLSNFNATNITTGTLAVALGGTGATGTTGTGSNVLNINPVLLGQVKLDNGTVTLPSITFSSDIGSNTGLYRIGENSIGFSVGGSNQLIIDSNGITSTKFNGDPNLTFSSNTSVAASNTAIWASNVSVYSSNFGITNSNVIYPSLTFSSNTSVAASNTAIFASNISVYSSNFGITNSNLIYPSLTFSSNTSVAASNTAIWASNASFFASNLNTNPALFGQVKLDNGTVTLPSITFSSDVGSNTGMYKVGEDSIGFSVGGSNRLTIDSSGITSIKFYGDGSALTGITASGASFDTPVWASNAALFGSNTSVYTSNFGITNSNIIYPSLIFSSNKSVAASNTAIFGSNTSIYSSNFGITNSNLIYPNLTFSSNTSIAASNTAIFGSNISVYSSNFGITNSNVIYPSLTFSSNTSIAASNTAIFGSNISVYSSNFGITNSNVIYPSLTFSSNTSRAASNTAIFGSNISVYSSNFGITNSNIIYPSLTFSSNTAIFGSNISVYSSNFGITNSNVIYPSLTFSSNTSIYASNTAIFASNTSFFASNIAVDAYNTAIFGSNTSVYSSNFGITNSNVIYPSLRFSSNTTVFGSNTSVYSSNFGITNSNVIYARLTFSSNTASWASNAVTGKSGADTAAAPGYTWSADSNTGMYNVGPDQIGFSTGGVNRVIIDSNGITSTKYYGDGSALTGIITSGATGGGADSAEAPAYTWIADTNTGMYNVGADQIGFSTGGSNRVNIGSNGIVFPNITVNRKIVLWDGVGFSGTTNDNQFYGMGVNASTFRFQIDETVSSYKWYAGTSTTTSTELMNLSGTGKLSIANNICMGIDTVANPGYSWTADSNTGIYRVGAGQIGFSTGGANRVTINSSGITAVGKVYTGVDTAALPGYTWTADTNTGMYNVGADQIGFSTGGVNRVTIGSNGIVLPNTLVSRKIVLYDNSNNDHQFTGMGINDNTFRFQTSLTSTFYRWYAGTNSNASSELMNLSGTGNLTIAGNIYMGADTAAAPSYTWTADSNTGIYNVGADQIGFSTGGLNRVTIGSNGILLSNIIANRKIVLWDGGITNDHQFYGIGINGSTLRFQISAGNTFYRWYAGTSTTTSDEVMSLSGTGNLVVANRIDSQRTIVNYTGAWDNVCLGINGADLNVAIPWLFYSMTSNTTPALCIRNTDGFTGIGTNAPTQKLDVNGNISADSFYVNASRAITTVISTSHGSVQTIGSTNSWGGYNINGEYAFMANAVNSSSCGIYNDIDNHWMIVCNKMAGVKLYFNNVIKLETTSTGVTVSGALTATSFIGDGSALTNLSAADIATGILGVARGGTGVAGSTGSGSNVLSVSPTLTGTTTIALLNVTGASTIGGDMTFGAGVNLYLNSNDTAATPGYSWSGDSNTGMYRAAADSIGFSTGGTNRVTINSTGITATKYFGDGSSLSGISSQWTTSGTKIYYSSGNVGVKVSNPMYTLQVNGSFGLGSTSESILDITDQTTYRRIQTWNSVPLCLNPAGNRVGVNRTNPAYTFDVLGDMGVTGILNIVGDYDTYIKAVGQLNICCNTNGRSNYFHMMFRLGSTTSSQGNIIFYLFSTVEHFTIGSYGCQYRISMTQMSDDRIKTDEEFITDATTTLNKLRPQIYNKWTEPDFATNSNASCYSIKESGLIAQEIFYDAPELRHLVNLPEDANSNALYNTTITSSDDPSIDPDYKDWGSKMASVNYIGLIPYLIKAIQEKDEEIIQLKSDYIQLEARMTAAGL